MENITVKGTLVKTLFQSNDGDFTIAIIRVGETIDGEVETDKWNCIKAVGNMSLNAGINYIFGLEEVDNPKYGKQYQVITVKRECTVENLTKEGFKTFLGEIATINQVKSIYEHFEDPRKVFSDGDFEALCTVKGVGEVTAKKLLQHYEEQKDYSEAYIEFGKWGFSPALTRKLVKSKGSVDLAIKILQDNPYRFIDVKGVGFKTIDVKALGFGIKPNDPRRVEAFIANYFDELAADGNSWVSAREFAIYLREEIYECDVEGAIKFIRDSDQYSIFKIEGESRIAANKYLDLEAGIAKELLRLLTSKTKMDLKRQDEIIKRVENKQGWTYSEKQREAVDSMLGKNVFVLQGLAGTGKSSCVNAVLQILQENNYSYEQCALSGKAADNLSQITGKNGSTIHRLLGYTGSGFRYNKQNPLPVHAVVLDEVSMVDIKIFYALVSALPNGAKLFLLGDGGQLDSIGVGIMEPLIESGLIPSEILTEIHRQALDSAMICHSLDFRKGKYPEDLVTKVNTRKVYGVNKDLGYTFVESKEEEGIAKETMIVYRNAIKKYPIKDIQIITSTIASGKVHCNMINDSCQRVANPATPDKKEIELKRSKDETFIIREGDKVIYVQNNRHTINASNPYTEKIVDGKTIRIPNKVPIFNGNTGLVESITYEIEEKIKKVDDVEVVEVNKVNIKIIVNFDGIGRVLLNEADIKSLQLGYCITVHKSQGSTIPCVIVALPFQFKLNSRELIYTAVTRASKFAYIVTSPKTLKSTLAKTSKKIHRTNLALLVKAEAVRLLKEKKSKKEGKKVA